MQARLVYKKIVKESNTLIGAVQKLLKQNCRLVMEQYLKDVQKARYDLIVCKHILIIKYIIKAGIMDELIDTELTGKILKHHASWHLIRHLHFIESQSNRTAAQGHDPHNHIESYLGAGFTFKTLYKDVYYKTFPGATDKG